VTTLGGPNDVYTHLRQASLEDFHKQYARVMDLRNKFWVDELVDIANDGRDQFRGELHRGGGGAVEAKPASG
jgi:hypothetical protein